jgi:peptidoglycan/xylan/chitin deacetylase (PgdA/CDA1 family)
MITFDDGRSSMYSDGYPILNTAGMAATCYITSGNVDTTGSYVTSSNLQTLYSAGWDIGNHTSNHIQLAYTGTITRVGSVATFTADSTVVHGLSSGNSVTIQGANNPSYNGTVTLIDTPTTTSFTYACLGTESASDNAKAYFYKQSITTGHSLSLPVETI